MEEPGEIQILNKDDIIVQEEVETDITHILKQEVNSLKVSRTEIDCVSELKIYVDQESLARHELELEEKDSQIRAFKLAMPSLQSMHSPTHEAALSLARTEWELEKSRMKSDLLVTEMPYAWLLLS